MGKAREAAMLALYSCHKEGSWSEVVLNRELARAELDSRDAALVSQLCYGVLQRQLLLDFYLSHFCAMKLEKLELKVLEALRLGAYQLLFLDKIPAMAAVNESVELTKRHSRNPRAAGLVNAVLRNLDRKRDQLPEPTGSWAARVSVRTSHPIELVEYFAALLGEEETEALLEANNSPAPVTAQANTLRCTAEELREALEEEGVAASAHPWLPDCLVLDKTGSIPALSAFQEGLFYIQDPAARLAVLAASPQEGERVLDLCAAPGGKSFAAALCMKDKGTVVSRDLYPRKIEGLRKSAGRLGISCIQASAADAWEPLAERFDLVIADVPCSGLGIIRKKPEIRYRPMSALDDLLPIQTAILGNAGGAVRPGGRLLYATCTVRPEENQRQVVRFLNEHPDFTLRPLELPAPFGQIEDGMLTLWPHRHGTDGFFFALLGREGSA